MIFMMINLILIMVILLMINLILVMVIMMMLVMKVRYNLAIFELGL